MAYREMDRSCREPVNFVWCSALMMAGKAAKADTDDGDIDSAEVEELGLMTMMEMLNLLVGKTMFIDRT